MPEQGSYIWADAEPHVGREIGGHLPEKNNIQRPFLVVSDTQYNKFTGFVHVMPITHKTDPARVNYFRILDYENQINGSLITDQILEHDFHARNGKIIGTCQPEILKQALEFVRDIYNL